MYYSKMINTLAVNILNNKFNRCCYYLDIDQENRLVFAHARAILCYNSCEAIDEILAPWQSMAELSRVPVT